MIIKSVEVLRAEGGVFSRVICDYADEQCDYAFYLYKGGKRVESRWYAKENNVEFRINQIGVYRVVGFVKKNEDVIWKSSSSFFFSGGDVFENRRLKLDSFLEQNEFSDAWYSLEVEGGGCFSLILSGFSNAFSKNNFLVVFNGAVKRGGDVTPPFFSGVNMAKQVEMPVVLFSDPSLELDDEITLGWYAGNYKLNCLQETMALVVNVLSGKIKSAPVFMGGSGGGFASLVALSLSEVGGTAVVWNPQTCIDKYHNVTVEKYNETAYPNDFNVPCNQIRQISYNNFSKNQFTIIYLQNIYDVFHVERHASPFFSDIDVDVSLYGIQKIDGNSVYILGCWKAGGHVSPPFEALVSIIKCLSTNAPLDHVSDTAKKYLMESV